MLKWLFPAAGLLLAACSTEGKVTALTGGTLLPTARTWALDVRGCNQAPQCEDIRSSLVCRLIGAGMAERVVAGNQPHDVVLEVRIERTRTVSGTERVLFGALAGRNEVVSTNRLLDRSGTVLRSFRIESTSAAHPFSGESGASDAYRQFATDTVSALR